MTVLVCKIASMVLLVLTVLSLVFEATSIEMLVIGFALALIVYVTGKILEHMELSNQYNYEINSFLKSQFVSKEQKPKVLPVNHVKRTENENWICANCHKENEKNATFCKDCGTYR